MPKQLIILLIFLFLVVAIGGYYFYITRSQYEIFKFVGDVVNIEGENITLHGVYDGEAQNLPRELSSDRDFSFKVNENTAFEKKKTRFLTGDELREKYGEITIYRYNIEDLPHEIGPGSFDELKELAMLKAEGMLAGNLIVEINFSSSIHNVRNPIASLVFYHYLNMPTSPPSSQTQ